MGQINEITDQVDDNSQKRESWKMLIDAIVPSGIDYVIMKVAGDDPRAIDYINRRWSHTRIAEHYGRLIARG